MLATDIAGAVGVDLDACWVLGGLHGASLLRVDGDFGTARAEADARQAGVAPVATNPRFVW